MEDLRVKNYRLNNQRDGMDIDQVELVLDQLALYHTLSYHWIATYPNGGFEAAKKDFPLLFEYTGWLGVISGGIEETEKQIMGL